MMPPIEITKNQWGDTSLRNDTRMRNGSMIVVRCGGKQGYDSRSHSYDPSLTVTPPVEIRPGQSLISTISNETVPVPNFARKLLWRSEQNCQCVLRTAAVLTCVSEPPPADAFRPPYGGTEKPVYRLSRIRWERLPSLAPAGQVPSWEEFERYFQRPWLDHLMSWEQQQLNPNENQPNYGREHGRIVSIASLMLCLDLPKEKKEKLLIGLVQYGIDLSGLAKAGGRWNEGGGHSSGRKWPILLASILLDDEGLRTLPPTAVFQEDTQTYYGTGWFGQTALWQMVIHHGPRAPYEEKHPSRWEEWDRTSEGYRLCCTAQAWIGTCLTALLMKAKKTWDHDAFFDYCDRWMRQDDPYAEKRGEHRRPGQEGKTYDPFVDAMWHAYRSKVPEQESAGNPRKWTYDGSSWRWVSQ